VVTLLTPPPLWELVEAVLAVEVEPVVVETAAVVAVDVLASAGSCPETSTIVISSQVATNSATEPPMIRRRIIRARAARDARIARARARALSALVSVMVEEPRCRSGSGSSKGSFDPVRITGVSED
jgi:hypothetical protein